MSKVTLGKWTDKNEKFTKKIRAKRIEEGVEIDILAKKAGLRSSVESLISAVYEGGD